MQEGNRKGNVDVLDDYIDHDALFSLSLQEIIESPFRLVRTSELEFCVNVRGRQRHATEE